MSFDDDNDIEIISDKEYDKKIIDEEEMECIRCTNQLHICICPDDMTFEEKFDDVVRRCLSSNLNDSEKDMNWQEHYQRFFARYFDPTE